VAVYSIKDLEMISGIKAHTLRIWEQRYHIIHPKRTPTNIRFYEDDDLKHLLNISLLNKNGLKISKIASMSEEEIAEAVSDLSKGSFEDSVQIDALTISMMELDEAKFETIIAANLQNLGFERTMMEVIYPFLDKLSLLWITGSIHPVQENFISNLVRQKLIAAIDALSANKSCHAGFTLYLPEGESQELSLLFLQYLIKKRGFRTLYLGQNTSLPDLAEACSIFPTDYVLTIISEGFTKQSVHQYLKDLQKVCEGKIIYVTGYQVLIQGIQTSENVVVLENLDSFTTLIDTLPCN
jgi:DNA-binding transcriptional MerR regulator